MESQIIDIELWEKETFREYMINSPRIKCVLMPEQWRHNDNNTNYRDYDDYEYIKELDEDLEEEEE